MLELVFKPFVSVIYLCSNQPNHRYRRVGKKEREKEPRGRREGEHCLDFYTQLYVLAKTLVGTLEKFQKTFFSKKKWLRSVPHKEPCTCMFLSFTNEELTMLEY